MLTTGKSCVQQLLFCFYMTCCLGVDLANNIGSPKIRGYSLKFSAESLVSKVFAFSPLLASHGTSIHFPSLHANKVNSQFFFRDRQERRSTNRKHSRDQGQQTKEEEGSARHELSYDCCCNGIESKTKNATFLLLFIALFRAFPFSQPTTTTATTTRIGNNKDGSAIPDGIIIGIIILRLLLHRQRQQDQEKFDDGGSTCSISTNNDDEESSRLSTRDGYKIKITTITIKLLSTVVTGWTVLS